MPDPIDTAGDPYSISSTLLDMFVGNDFRAMMKSVISLGVGDALRMHIGDTPFGPPALFAGQDVGRNLFEHFMQQTTSAMMQETAQVRERARFELNDRFAGMLGIDPARINPLGMTLTSFFGSELFRQMGTQQLELGLGMANRYMGALPISFVGEQNQERQRVLQDQLSNFNRIVMQDFVANFDQYGGMSGAGVGRILAEGARLGMIDSSDPRAAINFAQRTAQMVGTAQQFFQGSATEVMDQLNATLGVNAVATLGGPQGAGPAFGTGSQLNTLLSQMSATGMVTGLTDPQMRMLTTGAANVAVQRGGTPLGALANARDIALFATAANRSGVTAFVNEASLRQSIVNQVVRTQESEAARALYGAYAMIEARSGTQAAEEFLDRAGERGGDLTVGAITNMASGELGGISASQLIDAGFSQSAERARAGGGATVAMMQARLNTIQGDRARFLRQLDIDPTQFGGDLSVQNIERALRATGDPLQMAQMGRIRQVFAGQAERYGYRSAEEMDAALRSTRLAAQMREAMTEVSTFQLEMQGFGQVRGAMGFIQMVRGLRPGERTTGARALEALIGGSGADIRAQILNQAGLFKEENINAIMQSGDPNQIFGLDVAVQALRTGQIGGQRLTEEEMEDLREAFTTENVERRQELLKQAAAKANPAKRLEFSAAQATTAVMRRHGEFYVGELLSKEAKAEQRREMAQARREYADEGKLIAQLQEYERLAESEADPIRGSKYREFFGEKASEYQKIIERTGDVEKAREEFKATFKKDDEYRAFMQNLEANMNVQTSMGATAETAGIGRIVLLLESLFTRLFQDGIKTTNEASPTQAVKKD